MYNVRFFLYYFIPCIFSSILIFAESLYDDDDDDDGPDNLNMTMRKPWAPPGSRKTSDDRKPQK